MGALAAEDTTFVASRQPARRARWIAPMLATLAAEPFSRKGWLFEAKLDGVRCIAARSGNAVRLYSRNQILMNDRYPELVEALRAQQAKQFVVDGEIVAFREGVTSFGALQARMQAGNPAAELLRRVPVWFYLFDLLHLAGRDTLELPLRERKAMLQRALNFGGPLRYSEHREEDGEPYYREACRRGWEGIVGKRADSPYVSRRSSDWLKFKCINEQEFVIGGYTDPGGARTGFGALLVGYYEAGKLVYAGKVGTGYEAETLRRLSAQLASLRTARSPFSSEVPGESKAHWVEPKLVAQVGFAEWTSGGRLRQPRFQGLRTDKPPQDVVRERKIA